MRREANTASGEIPSPSFHVEARAIAESGELRLHLIEAWVRTASGVQN